MFESSLVRKESTLVESMPHSQAWMVDMTAQLTTCAHCVSPSATTGPSGSFENVSSRIVRASGPPSASGKFERTPAITLLAGHLPGVRVQPLAFAPADLAPDQLEAVSHRAGPARIIAPASA